MKAHVFKMCCCFSFTWFLNKITNDVLSVWLHIDSFFTLTVQMLMLIKRYRSEQLQGVVWMYTQFSA